MARMQLFLLHFLEIVVAETFFLLGRSSPGNTMMGSLIKNQTLISAGSVFQLGFFSPVNDSATAYIRIWYYNHPPTENKIVVWVANRNRSVNTSMASLNLTSDGNLILFEEGTKVWSTGTSAELNSARLQLLDSGNLALTAGNSNRILWQSFDHEGDTFLPGMKLGFDFRTNTPWQIVSWMSATDPSPGKYILRMETFNVPDFFMVNVNENESVKLFRTGPWNGQWFVGLPMLGNSIAMYVNFAYVSNQNETYFIAEYQTRSPGLLRLEVDANGNTQLLIFGGGEWNNSLLWLLDDDCDNYNRCGRNSVCTMGYVSISCRCLEGFENKSVDECARKEPLSCSSNQFSKEPNMKLPDTENATSRGNISLDKCKKLCLDDCFCVAYAVINGPFGCITWHGELLDLRNFTDGGDDLYIRLPGSSTSKNWKKLVWVIIISMLLGIFLLCGVGVLLRRRRNRALRFPNVEKGSISALDVLSSYDLHTIKVATNDFSEENKLGEGGFGVVYKGELDDGQKIAVKKLSRYSSQGSCIEGDERLMILEYMENKSLDTFIYDKAKSSLLNWQRRVDIIIGIARGLLYLHQDSRLRVIHRDLKPSNILLDKDMNPKISDFGIARIFEGDNALEDATTRPIGTFGYMAPEYLSHGVFSFKSDVFSFGMIVLEIISGKKNKVFSQTSQSATNLNLVGYVNKLWKEGRSLEILDDALNQSYPAEEVLRCIQMSLLCVQDNSNYRPTMTEVMAMLISEEQLFTPVMQPAITSTSSEGGFTANEMSFTLVGQ
ncbi:receptor-like serine/threonine-protein kinase SD1-7 isoform X2 [Zingiber officinale]|uniref:receptor-like serine/threonine-protein kinase SD1-7 isoform X2 n=1 Tax=Zingiber officinale TaxID=94328 RepID=UPI001C4AFA84|nr:receptor-like serine/threonine-protein kinase SD1-7 isoform X2 [Zingiber officinale]